MTVTRILELWETTDSGDSRIDHGALLAFARRVEALALERAAQLVERNVNAAGGWTCAARSPGQLAAAVRALSDGEAKERVE